MKKLFELLGTRRVNGEYGMEIEVEGRYLPEVLADKRWRAEKDGSLRGESMEYILSKPLMKADIRNALESLERELLNSKLDFSFRTSVHVHMNVQNLTYPQYLALLYTYLLLEEPLVNFCGKERKGNRFCLRLQDAEGLLDTFNMLFRNGEESLHGIHVDNVRYAAVNVGATVQYGSLEFRAMRGNLDVDTLVTWVEILDCLKQFAIKADNPRTVYDLYAKHEAVGFIQTVLGEYYDVLKYPRMQKDMQRSFSLSLDLPFAYQEVVQPKKVANKVKNPNFGVGNIGGRVPVPADWLAAAARPAAQFEVVFDELAPIQIEANAEV